MKTTAVVLNYNGADFITQNLLLLDKESCEIVVVDNGSTDDSLYILENLDIKYKLVKLKDNMGFAKGNNIGSSHVKTDNILFINNDTIPKTGFLKKMENNLNKYDVVGCKIIFGKEQKHKVPYEKGEFIFSTKAGKVQHAGIDFYKEGMPFEYGRNLEPNDPRVIKSREVKAVTAACMLINKKVFDEAGGFSGEYINGWEDTDLCLRLLEKNRKIYYEADAEILHFCSSSPGRFLKEQQNKETFENKWIKTGRINKLI